MNLFQINYSLIPIKGYYFFSNAGASVIVPYLSVYMKQIGISAETMGIMFMVLYGGGTLSKTGFGFLADKLRCKKFLFLFSEVLMLIGFICFLLAPKLQPDQNYAIAANRTHPVLTICSANQEYANSNYTESIQESNIRFEFLCDDGNGSHPVRFESNLNETRRVENAKKEICLEFPIRRWTGDRNVKSSDCRLETNSRFLDEFILVAFETNVVFWMPKFWILFGLLIVSWTAMAVMVSLGDTICFQSLGDRPSDFGKQRVFGSIGFGLFVLISGLLIFLSSDQTSINENYQVVITVLIVACVLNFLFSLRLKYVNSNENHNLCRNIALNLFKWKVLFFYLWCFLIGIFTAVIWNFLFYHLELLYDTYESSNETNYKKILLALASFLQSWAGEIPFFAISGWIIRKIGRTNSMHLVSLCFSVRFLLYSIVTNPWFVLPIEISNGITVGLFYPTMTTYAYAISAPGTEATMQGISGAIFEGIGGGLGSYLLGTIIQDHGTIYMFKLFGSIGIVFTIVHYLIERFCFRESNSYPLPKM